jgi:histidinol phosphatase-like PHP family hydrolase
MDRHIIDHIIPKEAEGTYYTVDFPVPSGLERVTVSYSYKRLSGKMGRLAKIVNIVDLGLMDCGGQFLGWSGSAKSMVFVGPYASTNGYLMTGIESGEWSIIVGAYKIPDGGLEVRYEIEYTRKGTRWLTGDTHMHSNASDGQHGVATLAEKARCAGLDFIAVSNHNNYAENLNLPVVPGLTLVPAVEWTHYRGHMNFFGVAAPFENSFVANSEEEMLALVAEARAKGAVISVNHPKCTLCPYLWQSEDAFDLVEVWNGPMRKVNTDAIAWWHDMLVRGRRIPLVGGSDYHRDRHPVRFAHPVTRVYARSPKAKDILDAIARGNSYVMASTGGVMLDIRCENAMMGDAVDWREGMKLSIYAEGLRAGINLKLITSEGVAGQWGHLRRDKFETEVTAAQGWRFAYLVAARNLFGWEYVRAITNPIYFN